jgi:1-aminocyclopropane-1-carboxylate deaminase/D-cysteine desulfhydrase-like pyridoxal-dependent ACC family enzyme
MLVGLPLRFLPSDSVQTAHARLPSFLQTEKAVYGQVGNIQLSRLMGGDVRLVPAGFGIEDKPSLARAVDEVKASGGRVSGLLTSFILPDPSNMY